MTDRYRKARRLKRKVETTVPVGGEIVQGKLKRESRITDAEKIVKEMKLNRELLNKDIERYVDLAKRNAEILQKNAETMKKHT